MTISYTPVKNYHELIGQQGDDDLLSRYGSTAYYEDVFNGIEFYDVKGSFNLMTRSKSSHCERYEMARQLFLRLLGQYKIVWHPTVGNDRHIEISRIYDENKDEFIALMCVKPNGYRQERRIQPGAEMTFHLLLGRVAFKLDKRPRILVKGSRVSISSRNSYSIRSLCDDQNSYLVFRIRHRKPAAQPLTLTTGDR